MLFSSLSMLCGKPCIYTTNNYYYFLFSELLLAIDQWLKERHSLPYSNPDLLFSTDSTGHSLVGIIQDIVNNPLLSIPSEPPEDKLVIALNNPVFVPIEDTTNF